MMVTALIHIHFPMTLLALGLLFGLGVVTKVHAQSPVYGQCGGIVSWILKTEWIDIELFARVGLVQRLAPQDPVVLSLTLVWNPVIFLCE